jgi:hypothetical protein
VIIIREQGSKSDEKLRKEIISVIVVREEERSKER